jgi:hypothetical protein
MGLIRRMVKDVGTKGQEGQGRIEYGELEQGTNARREVNSWRTPFCCLRWQSGASLKLGGCTTRHYSP